MSPNDVTKALTISQPFAHLIASGRKWTENRKWYSNYEGWLAIHAGKGTQYMTKQEASEKGYHVGAIVAVARMTACVNYHAACAHVDYHDEITTRESGGLDRLALSALTRHEFSEGPFCFVLRDVTALPDPVPCNGALGFWTIKPETKSLIVEQLERIVV